MLGRVLGADIALSAAASPLGIVAVGYAVESVGLTATFTGIAACWLVVVVISVSTPAFHEMDESPAVSVDRGA